MQKVTSGIVTDFSVIGWRIRDAFPLRVATDLRSSQYFSSMNSMMVITSSTTAMAAGPRGSDCSEYWK